MTGRDLIIYILQNDLEDEDVVKDGHIIGFMNEYETAAKMDVGVETVRVWYQYGILNGFKIGDSVFFPVDIISPQSKSKE